MDGVFATSGTCSKFPPRNPQTSDIESDAFGTPDSGDGGFRDPIPVEPDDPAAQRRLQLSLLGEDAVQETWELAVGDDYEWQLDIDTPEVSVWSCTHQDRRILKSEGLVHVSPSVLFHMLHEELESQARWNPIISRCETIESIDRYTDITYTVTSAHAGGMVGVRS